MTRPLPIGVVLPDRITCQECGRTFRSLDQHLIQAHAMSGHDYRMKYKILMTIPLICEDLRKSLIERGVGYHIRGTFNPQKLLAEQKARGTYGRGKVRPQSEHTRLARDVHRAEKAKAYQDFLKSITPKLTEMWTSDLSISEIASIFGVESRSIDRWKVALKLPPRVKYIS